MKLQSFASLQAVRSDNVKKLKSTLNKWYASIDIEPEYIIVYNSLQNDVAERAIRITKNQIRIMLQNADLPLEFWPEADEANIYVRNRVAIDLVINDETTCLMEAWTSVKPLIDHLRVWGCKCYSSIDIRSLSNEVRIDKLVNIGRPDVFMNYDENITT